MSWCTQWKGTPQDCINHISAKHHVGDSVKTASLGKWLPPWAVSRAKWHMTLKSKVSGISTDATLFTDGTDGAQLVHHYRVFGDYIIHISLRGSFVIKLLYFTNRACAAQWAAKCSRNSGTGSRSSPARPAPLPRDTTQGTLDDDPPVRKAPQAVSLVVPDKSLAGTSAVVSADKYSVPQVPRMCSVPSGWWRPILPVLLPLPPFATQVVVLYIGQSSSVATQRYSSSPGSRSSTPCLDLAAFDSECYWSAKNGSPVSAVIVDRGIVGSQELGDMSTITSRFSPLNPQQSPVSMLSVAQVVVESPTLCLAADRVVTLLPQESQVSQLSPNRVREDFDFDNMDVFPVFPSLSITDCSGLDSVVGTLDSASGYYIAPALILLHTYPWCQPPPDPPPAVLSRVSLPDDDIL